MSLQDYIKRFKAQDLDGEALICEIWRTDLSIKNKIVLSLEMNDLGPSYSILMNMWLEYKISNSMSKEWNELIYSYYFSVLSGPDKDFATSIEYSLYFDSLEDPDKNREAWIYFLNRRPNERFLRIMLANSGPVPYDLKHQLYESLIKSTAFHFDIYVSISQSCFDNCGAIDKQQALGILKKLNLTEQLKKLNNERGVRKYKEVVSYLSDSIES